MFHIQDYDFYVKEEKQSFFTSINLKPTNAVFIIWLIAKSHNWSNA